MSECVTVGVDKDVSLCVCVFIVLQQNSKKFNSQNISVNIFVNNNIKFTTTNTHSLTHSYTLFNRFVRLQWS